MQADTLRRTLPVGAAFMLASVAALAADALKIQMVTRVPEGQQPRLKLTAVDGVDAIKVDLARDDGKQVASSFGATTRGTTRDVPLPGDAGTHHYRGHLYVTRGANTSANSLDFETVVAPQLKITLDKARVDLQARRLELQVSRPAGKV